MPWLMIIRTPRYSEGLCSSQVLARQKDPNDTPN